MLDWCGIGAPPPPYLPTYPSTGAAGWWGATSLSAGAPSPMLPRPGWAIAIQDGERDSLPRPPAVCPDAIFSLCMSNAWIPGFKPASLFAIMQAARRSPSPAASSLRRCEANLLRDGEGEEDLHLCPIFDTFPPPTLPLPSSSPTVTPMSSPD